MTTKTSFRLLYLCIPLAALFFATMNAESVYPQGVSANDSFSPLEAELLLPATRTPTPTPNPTNTPTPTPSSSSVTIEGHIYYEALSSDSGTSAPVTNPLARVRIQVLDDSGTFLGETWAENACPTCNAGHYSITVPNNEPNGIDPFLKIIVENFGQNPPDSRVQIVDPSGNVYTANTSIDAVGEFRDRA
jgi:hypothetical protein